MSDQAMLEHIKRLDRLYLAADTAYQTWMRDSTLVNRRRWRYYQDRYQAAVIEGAKRFGWLVVAKKRGDA